MPLLLLYLSAVIPLAGGIVQPTLGVAGFWLTVLITVVAFVDRLTSPGPEQIEVERQTATVLSVGRENSIRLVLRNRGQRLLNVQLHDTPPQPATILGLPLTVAVPGHSIRIATWKLIPGRRGNGRFGDVSLQCLSRLKLWTLLENRPLPADIRLYPDIQAVQGVELLARQNRLSQAGVRLSRLRGRGSDFDRLREYQREDEYRSIDWKATARHQQLISREYVVEKNQTILFLLDCGRSMCNEADGISHFDRALNAVILLSCVALRQGDSVGVLACSNAVERWVAPLHGRQAVRQLTGRIYDLQPRYEATDYDLMISELRRRYRRRCLVVLVTHVLDDVHLAEIAPRVQQLRSPHLVLTALMKNVPLQERMNDLPASPLDAFQIAAAASLAGRQEQQMARLEKSGLLVCHARPEELSGQLISQYLEIKARHLL